MARVVPPNIKGKWQAWRYWSSVWNWMHYITGFTSAALTVLIAANTKSAFLAPTTAVTVACIAAGLAFLVTAMGAQARGKGFELAARELEGPITDYLLDETVPEKVLAEGVRRGIDVLNEMK